MAFNLAPLPLQDDVIEGGPKDKRTPISKTYAIWFQETLIPSVQQATQVKLTLPLSAQSAAILATPFTLGSVATGLYRVSYYARITQAATVSSSLTVTIGWTDGAIPCTASGAAITGNTTATTQSGSFLVRIDQASPLTYATTYASSGVTAMQYKLEWVIELLA